MAEEFGKAVLVVIADDKAMHATLKADEQLVTKSVGKMQGDLNRLTVTTQKTSGAAFNASAGMSAMSASAGMLSGVLGSTISRGVASIQMLQQMKLAMAGVSNTMLGALGIIGALILFREEIGNASRWIGETVFGLDNLTRAERRAAEALREFEAAFDFEKKVEAIADQLRVLTEEGFTEMDAKARQLIRTTDMTIEQIREYLTLQQDLAAAKAADVAAETDKRAEQARQLKIQNMRDQLAILTGQVTAEDLIADIEERRLAIQLRRTREANAERTAAEATARAQATRFEGAGPTTTAEANRLVSDTLGLVRENQRSAALTTAAFTRIVDRLGLSVADVTKLQQALGIAAEKKQPEMAFGAGAIAVTAFAATGTKALATQGAPERERERRERKRTDNSDAIRANTERLALAFDRGLPWEAG